MISTSMWKNKTNKHKPDIVRIPVGSTVPAGGVPGTPEEHLGVQAGNHVEFHWDELVAVLHTGLILGAQPDRWGSGSLGEGGSTGGRRDTTNMLASHDSQDHHHHNNNCSALTT